MIRKQSFILLLTFLCMFCMNEAFAQQILLETPAKRQSRDAKEEYSRPPPQIFSSQITSTEEAKKLDKLYDGLIESLWLYASSDFNAQKKLMGLIKPQKFQNTRYGKEFEIPLRDAMKTLNRNYKSMKTDTQNAQDLFQDIKLGIKKTEQDLVQKLWNERIKELSSFSKQHFQTQHKFLNMYKNLVGFVIKENGGYYYKTNRNQVFFYKNGAYRYFAQSIDALKRIQYQQRQHLRQKQPANNENLL